MNHLLVVNNLTVDFVGGDSINRAVNGISFHIDKGEVLAVVGESGSGKSVAAMAVMGLNPENARTSGSIVMDGIELTGLTQRQRRRQGDKRAAIIFQDPVGALNPVFTVGFQLVESIRLHYARLSRKQARLRAIELLATVGIPDPERRMGFYPHQFSGGQCQRVMIAMALAGDPDLLIADEPTTALDVTVQAEILDLMRDLGARRQTAILLITHDMGVVADFADRVVVMKGGQFVEQASVDQLFYHPREDYTKELLSAVPQLSLKPRASAPRSVDRKTVLRMKNIVVDYGARSRSTRFRAIDDVSLDLASGDFVGLVGESGSGKSTLGRVAMGAVRPASGEVEAVGKQVAELSASQLRAHRARLGMVFQNPTNSLDPRYTVEQSIGESLHVHRGMGGKQLRLRVAELLDMVGLPKDWGSRYPHEMSGGQRQRVSIARAIALDPELLIADEPTSALDVSVQAKVLHLFRTLQADLRFACLFISHDLAVVDQVCDRVIVLKGGKMVEQGDVSDVLLAPQEPYTKLLLAASPLADPLAQRARRAGGVYDSEVTDLKGGKASIGHD